MYALIAPAATEAPLIDNDRDALREAEAVSREVNGTVEIREYDPFTRSIGSVVMTATNGRIN